MFLLHEAEEWNIYSWWQTYFTDGPASALSVRLWLVVVTLDMFLLTWAATRFRSERVVALVLLPVVAMASANGLEHVWWLVHLGAYAPGVIFGGLAGVALGLYLFRRALAERLVPTWYAWLFGAYALATLALAVRAGDTMPPLIRAITAFSDRAAALVVRHG